MQKRVNEKGSVFTSMVVPRLRVHERSCLTLPSGPVDVSILQSASTPFLNLQLYRRILFTMRRTSGKNLFTVEEK